MNRIRALNVKMHKPLLLCSFILLGGFSARVDSLTKCKKGSPDFGECLVKNAMAEVTSLEQKGNPKLKLNSLNPVLIERVDLQATPSLRVGLRNAKLQGFQSLIFHAIDLSDTELKMDTQLDRLNMIADYDINGQLLVLPLQGVGDCNITLGPTKPKYRATLEIVEKNGQKHYHIKDSKMEIEPEHVYYQFNNLFNGDKRLGDEMNKFMNEGWKDVFEEVRGAVCEMMLTVFNIYISGYFDTIPINDLVE